MGNPPILRRDDESPPDVAPPMQPRLLWIVYELRDGEGEKVDWARALQRGKVGLLKLWRGTEGELTARLTDPSGYPALLNLYRVRLHRLDSDKGLLLHGTQIGSRLGAVSEFPQAWWCLVHAAEPRDRE